MKKLLIVAVFLITATSCTTGRKFTQKDIDNSYYKGKADGTIATFKVILETFKEQEQEEVDSTEEIY
jgi:hypothetical protein